MKTLYINTATQQTTIALFEDEQLMAEKRWPAEQKEAERLQPAVETLLKGQKLIPADVGRLVVCVGPGGFTSVRVGVSAVNAWAFANNIPVAQVSIFELYRDPEAIIVVSANSNEGWVKQPGKSPEFLRLESLTLPEQFSFAGLLHDDWVSTLKNRGGTLIPLPEELPEISNIEFQSGIVKPWYYKDANITWSNKHDPVRRLNTDR